jgi:nucleoid DNA-binding protein
MLNKAAIVERLKESLGYKYQTKDLTEIVEKFSDVILDAISNGEEVYISSFGKFFVKVSKPREIKNAGIPWLKGKTYSSKEKLKIGFRPSSTANRQIVALQEALIASRKGQY